MPIFSHTVTGYLFALLATVVWSGNFVVARGLAGALSPVELSFWRWSIAFLTILPFAGRSLLRSLPLVRGTWGKVILMALLGITCFNTFSYQAGHTTDAKMCIRDRPCPIRTRSSPSSKRSPTR